MQFCPKCGAILVMGSNNMSCPRCSYSQKEKADLEVKEKGQVKKIVAVIGEGQGEVHPITDYKCEKCGHEKSYFWLRQMRAGDEPESRFYKCVKCKNTVRED